MARRSTPRVSGQNAAASTKPTTTGTRTIAATTPSGGTSAAMLSVCAARPPALVQAASSLQTQNYQHAQQAPGQHRAGPDQGNLAQFVTAGQAPASGAVAQAPQHQTTPQGQAPQTGPQTQKGPDLTK